MKHTLRVMKSSTTPWFKAKKNGQFLVNLLFGGAGFIFYSMSTYSKTI